MTFIFRALFDKCLTKKQQLETKQPLEQQQQQQTNVYCNDNNLNNANLLLLSSSSSFSPSSSSSSNEIDASQTKPPTTTTARIIMNENDENANTCSLVKCADVIEYFSNDINNQVNRTNVFFHVFFLYCFITDSLKSNYNF